MKIEKMQEDSTWCPQLSVKIPNHELHVAQKVKKSENDI